MDKLKDLFESYTGQRATESEELNSSGSNRRYFRLKGGNISVVGVVGTNKEENEVETCFNALYGTMLLRLQQKEVSDKTQAAVKEITTFIGMLSDYYKKDKEEGLKFE